MNQSAQVPSRVFQQEVYVSTNVHLGRCSLPVKLEDSDRRVRQIALLGAVAAVLASSVNTAGAGDPVVQPVES